VASVRLLFFARAREAAGRRDDVVDASTLGELLEHARGRYGPGFAEVLASSRVWINGDEPTAGDATALCDGDEVAVLPPVSGGASERTLALP
jgi:molybdopterin synthase sulfur carrier subunit